MSHTVSPTVNYVPMARVAVRGATLLLFGVLLAHFYALKLLHRPLLLMIFDQIL